MANNSTKKPEINVRISEIREYFCGGNNIEFAKLLGFSTPRASNLCNREPNIGKEALEKILSTFPTVSRSWLYFGEGEMLQGSVNNIHTHNQTGDNYQGNVHVDKSSETESLRRLIDEKDARIKDMTENIADLRELVKELRKQVEILEKMDR